MTSQLQIDDSLKMDDLMAKLEAKFDSKIEAKIQSKVEEIKAHYYLAMQNYCLSRISPQKAPTSKHFKKNEFIFGGSCNIYSFQRPP